MARTPNTQCQYCQTPIYRRPCQIKKQAYLVCGNCRGKFSSTVLTKKMKGNYEGYIAEWKAGNVSGMRGQDGISLHIRRYLFEQYNNQCCKCGWSQVNSTTGKIPLEVNHIDGIHTNNLEQNLELICPNCHSLTDSYRALNKGKGRIRT